MNLSIFSLYWDNIDDRIVWQQKKVMERMQLPMHQHRINLMDHGTWMEWVMRRNDDLILFMDIDCIVLDRQKTLDYAQMAANGTLVGNIQATNHLGAEVASKTFAAPSFLFVNKRAWMGIGEPAFKATPYGDVAQLLTDTWRKYEVPVELIPITSVEQPKWNLPDKELAYGIGTTFGNCNYHLFESRQQANIERFLTKCGDVLNG